MPPVLTAALIAIGLVGLNVWLLRTNQKTPVPEGCENLKPECESCGLLDCSVRKIYQEEKEGN